MTRNSAGDFRLATYERVIGGLVTLLVVVLTGLTTWILCEVVALGKAQAAQVVSNASIDARVRSLEGWRDTMIAPPMPFGR
jgi:hypothetical protein